MASSRNPDGRAAEHIQADTGAIRIPKVDDVLGTAAGPPSVGKHSTTGFAHCGGCLACRALVPFQPRRVRWLGGRVGLLFQPRWSGHGPAPAGAALRGGAPIGRQRVMLAALEALVLGDASRFGDLFTGDVMVSGPHVVCESLGELQQALGLPEDSLTDLVIVALALDTFEDKLICEWRLEATFTQPVLYDDRLLIEPTGGAVRLLGVSVAEFVGERIRTFRHYFDDTELLASVPGVPSHLRWRFDG